MIPSVFFPKKDYQLVIDGVKVEAKVAEKDCDIDSFLTMVRSNASSPPGNNLLGFDVKVDGCGRPKLLLLCNGSHCLIINLFRCGRYVKSIFENEEFGLVGINVAKLRRKRSVYVIEVPWIEIEGAINSALGLSDLASLAFQKRQFKSYGLRHLGSLVGVDVKPGIQQSFCRDDIVFTKETIKEAFYDVYYSYVIARKLLDRMISEKSLSAERYIIDLFSDEI